MEEKRRSTRFRIPAPAIVTIGDREVWAFTREISTRAAYFRTAGEGDEPRTGERLEFLIKIPPSLSYAGPCFIKGWGHVHRIDELAGNERGFVVEILDYTIEAENA